MIKVGDKAQVYRNYNRKGDVGKVLSKRMTQFGILYLIKFKDGIAEFLGDSVRKVE